MLLAMDVGNSKIHVGIFDGELLRERFSLKTDTRRTADEYAELLALCLKRRTVAVEELSGAAVANVVMPLQHSLLAACQLIGIPAPLLVGPGIKTRLKIRFEPPTELGGDRIANAVAAIRHVAPEVIVVDLGTATTFDCVVDGEYTGVVAAPGVESSFTGLAEKAPRLPRIEFVAPERIVARSGSGALQSGLIAGHAAMCDGMIQRIREEIGQAVVVTTGDFAELIGPLMRTEHIREPALTLLGLKILYDLNNERV